MLSIFLIRMCLNIFKMSKKLYDSIAISSFKKKNVSSLAEQILADLKKLNIYLHKVIYLRVLYYKSIILTRCINKKLSVISFFIIPEQVNIFYYYNIFLLNSDFFYNIFKFNNVLYLYYLHNVSFSTINYFHSHSIIRIYIQYYIYIYIYIFFVYALTFFSST